MFYHLFSIIHEELICHNDSEMEVRTIHKAKVYTSFVRFEQGVCLIYRCVLYTRKYGTQNHPDWQVNSFSKINHRILKGLRIGMSELIFYYLTYLYLKRSISLESSANNGKKACYVFNEMSVGQGCPVVRTAYEQDPIGSCTHTVGPANQPPTPRQHIEDTRTPEIRK